MTMLDLMFITNDPFQAQDAANVKTGRIFIDLEILGKRERQKNKDTFITDHKIDDVRSIKHAINDYPLMVRINPINTGSRSEIEQCINSGATTIMLPMFQSVGEVEKFVEYVDGRANVCLLLETPQALCRVHEIVSVKGIDEIHVGINDLHIGMQLDFMFELLSGGIIDYIADAVKCKGIRFGFGGIAKVGQGIVPAEMIIGEHYRIGSEMAILSRSFRDNNENGIRNEIDKIRKVEKEILNWSESDFDHNRKNMIKTVNAYVSAL